MSKIKPQDIDAILPQTQCGLCGYGGCMPYAQALLDENAAINLCPPGGIKSLLAIADLLNKDASPFIAEMEMKAKPKLVASIRENECIGCTKCIQACPVDAILGSAKNMHTIIANECTGCELCISPCPVDCIDMLTIDTATEQELNQKADVARKRFHARNQRIAFDKKTTAPQTTSSSVQLDKKEFLSQVLLRAKAKKSNNNKT
jgi:Na+-translocating ferredoxin:NAD+ oxidoreductase subunit B